MLDESWLLDNMVSEVDDGTSTLFWKDPWLEGSSLDVGFRRLFELADNNLETIAEMFFGVRG